MSNPVPPPGSAYPPQPPQGQPGFPPPPPIPAQGQPGYPAQGQPGFPAQGHANYPAQGQSSFPAPGQPGYSGSGQPGYSGPGQPGYSGPGQPDLPPPPPPVGQPGSEQFGHFPGQAPKKSGRTRLVRVIGALVLVVAATAFKFAFLNHGSGAADKAKGAKVGDCVAAQGKVPTQEGKTTQTDAEVVDCTSSKAAYTVVGRVDGETDTNSKSCDKFFTDAKADYFVYSSTSGDGYLLCLKSKKA